jgi:hypothetical protein
MSSILVELRSSFGCLSRSGLRFFSRNVFGICKPDQDPCLPYIYRQDLGNDIFAPIFIKSYQICWNVRGIYYSVLGHLAFKIHTAC